MLIPTTVPSECAVGTVLGMLQRVQQPHDLQRPIRSVAVIGCGLMGGSIALAAEQAGLRVSVFDTDARTMTEAAERGLLAASSVEEASADADLVVLAIPADETPEMVQRLLSAVSRDAIITEIGSVKAPLSGVSEITAGRSVSFIPSHPMAGSEKVGFAHADAAILDGATWLLCPGEDEAELHRFAGFVRDINGGSLLQCSWQDHDTVVAIASHLPQVASSLLAATIGDVEKRLAPGALAASGGGFRDTTRIADSPYSMWGPIVQGNKEILAQLLGELASRTTELARAIEEGEFDKVRALFEDARGARDTWRRSKAALNESGDLPG